MPQLIDVLFAIAIVVVYPVWDLFVSWPKARRRLEAGEPGARWRLYRQAIVTQWCTVSAIAILWIATGRSASLLYLTAPTGWRLPASVAVIVAILGLYAAQMKSLVGISVERRIELRPKLRQTALILPHDET